MPGGAGPAGPAPPPPLGPPPRAAPRSRRGAGSTRASSSLLSPVRSTTSLVRSMYSMAAGGPAAAPAEGRSRCGGRGRSEVCCCTSATVREAGARSEAAEGTHLGEDGVVTHRALSIHLLSACAAKLTLLHVRLRARAQSAAHTRPGYHYLNQEACSCHPGRRSRSRSSDLTHRTPENS